MVDNPDEWFQAKIVDLENNLKKKDALLDIKSFVLNCEKNTLKELSSKVSIKYIFECLQSSDKQEIEAICIILYELLNGIPSDVFLRKYGEYIHGSLNHSSNKVKETILKLLQNTDSETSIEFFTKNHSDILLDATECLGSEHSATAEAAKALLVKFRNNPSGASALFSEPIILKMKSLMELNEVTKIRVYELYIGVALISAKYLSAAVSNGIMGSLLSELTSTDILMQLNALEVLSTLASCNHGLTFLQEEKVVQTLIDKYLKTTQDPATINLLLPGLVEFIGNLITLQPEHFTAEHPEIMDLLFSSLETPDEILLGVIISAVGKIGATPSGRAVLNNYDSKISLLFKKIGQILKTKNDLTVSTMNSLCELIKNISNNDDLELISRKWFESITPSAMDSVVGLSKLPFVEFRLSALGVLKAVATQNWGVQKLCTYPGLIEFLTDRSSEFNKDCKQTKFEVVENILKCGNIEEIISEQVLFNLKEFVKAGPFFIPAQMEMATEGAT